MKAFFYDLEWNKGSTKLVQGIKDGRRPRNAIAGGNGSFICSTPAELILSVETTDRRVCKYNIISLARGVNGWQRINEKRYRQIKEKLERIERFEIGSDGYILGLAGCLEI